MWRWLVFVLIFTAGITAIATGLYIELEVQAEVGDWIGAANQFHGREIGEYREQVLQCLIGGPLLLALAYCLRPRARTRTAAKKSTENLG